MCSENRSLSYSRAINEALHQVMAADSSVFLIGQGVKSPWYVGNATINLLERFSPIRVIDTPVSENAITGAAIGAAIAGMRPVVVHPRMDFMMYAFDPIINEAANWHYMFGGNSHASVVIWGIINRGGEQAAQHSQSLHSLFAHVPGLKVVMPSTPYDAKGLLVSAIRDDNPVIFVDDRWLYNYEGHVPKEVYSVEIGKGIIRNEGDDITLLSSSYMVIESMKAVRELSKEGVSIELIDIRSAKPLDKELILESVKKTGAVVITDGSWKTCGLSAEISALIADEGFNFLKAPVKRTALPDLPAPASYKLENAYYPSCTDIVSTIKEVLSFR